MTAAEVRDLDIGERRRVVVAGLALEDHTACTAEGARSCWHSVVGRVAKGMEGRRRRRWLEALRVFGRAVWMCMNVSSQV
jgi:hypothetical protein